MNFLNYFIINHREHFMSKKLFICLSMSVFTTSILAATLPTKSFALNQSQIEQLTGAKGIHNQQERVFKVSVPRTDLSVTVGGVNVTPAMGLTSWAAFTTMGSKTMVMGDMVLTENQVNTVMSVALDNNLQVTALHNHFMWDTPKVMFMHIEGMGDEVTLASSIGKVFNEIKRTSQDSSEIPKANINPINTTLNPKKIAAILGVKGILKDGVYKVTISRTTKVDNYQVGDAMGVNTWAAFAGSDNQAVVDGDFAMKESELRNVLVALRHAGIYIVAIHQHMIGEQPRIMFLHYWGIGPTESLAKGLRAALDKTSDK